MVLLTNISDFETKSIDIIRKSPKKARLTTKFRRQTPVFEMKITDGQSCFKVKLTKDNDIKKAQKLIASITHLMTSSEIMT